MLGALLHIPNSQLFSTSYIGTQPSPTITVPLCIVSIQQPQLQQPSLLNKDRGCEREQVKKPRKGTRANREEGTIKQTKKINTNKNNGQHKTKKKQRREFIFSQQPHALITIVLGSQRSGKFLFFSCFAKSINFVTVTCMCELLTHAYNNGFCLSLSLSFFFSSKKF